MSRIEIAVWLIASCLSLHFSHPLRADEPADVAWTKPFQPISASEAANKLVVMVVTNDESFLENANGVTPPIWCKPIIKSVIRTVLQSRGDIEDKIVLQSIRAGTPTFLSGQTNRNHPQRAFVVICDGNYRLLAIAVGVPDEQIMLRLIEDAQFVQTLRTLHSGDEIEDANKRIDEIVTYHEARMPRLWREALKRILKTVRQDAQDGVAEAKPDDLIPRIVNQRTLVRIGESFEGVYLSDVKQRFALRDASDAIRMAVIEQHPQARQPWCEAMLPFMAGSDVRQQWRSIAELVWKRAPVADTSGFNDNHDDKQWLAWWDQQHASGWVILAIDPPLLASLIPWPPVNVDNLADKRGLGWKDFQNMASQHAFRRVTHQQLANLIWARDLRPIDLLMPTPARYVMYQSKRAQGVAVHENDLPAKFIGRIKSASKQ